MLSCMVLCLAAGVTTVFADVYPVFNDVYRVFVVYRNKEFYSTNYLWYDGINNKSRADGNKAWWTMMGPSAEDKYGRFTAVGYITTETQMNMKVCFSYAGDSNRVYGLMSDFIPFDFTFVLDGREVVNGVVAEKWVSKLEEAVDFVSIRYWWVTYKELHGVRQAVPVRFESIYYQLNGGDLFNNHFIFEYYDYDTGPIDPDIFDIQKGLHCHHHWPDIEIQQNQELNHLFTKLPRSGHFADFMQFRDEHGKYDSKTERDRRQEIFKQNLKMIESHNRGEHGYKLALNHLADRTQEEIVTTFGRVPSDAKSDDELRIDGALPFPYSDAEIEALSKELPEEFDWRLYGGINPVKLSYCNDAYAFSAVGAVEGALFVQSNRTRLVRLSEQVILDCGFGFNLSCVDGSSELTFEWIMKHGIPTNDAYGDYQAMEGYCRLDEVIPATTISGYVKVKNDTNALKLAIFKHGPVSVQMFVSRHFVFYSGGIYYEPFCPTKMKWLNYSFLVVGWGVLDGRQYWILRSSASVTWGVDGYAFVAADKGNLCGILTSAYYVKI